MVEIISPPDIPIHSSFQTTNRRYEIRTRSSTVEYLTCLDLFYQIMQSSMTLDDL